VVDSFVQSRAGTEEHRLSLIGISALTIADRTGGLPMTVAEIREFGVAVRPDGLSTVDINVSDQLDLQIACREVVFDEESLKVPAPIPPLS
jgi:hypothetical protein